MNAPEQTILCTTNIAGAMGKGVALAAKRKYPKVYVLYRKLYQEGKMHANLLCTIRVTDSQQVLLFPTKIHWRGKSPVDLILDNLKRLEAGIDKLGIDSLAIPPLGMGNGWLDKDESKVVLDAIKAFGESVDIDCTLYLPDDMEYK